MSSREKKSVRKLRTTRGTFTKARSQIRKAEKGILVLKRVPGGRVEGATLALKDIKDNALQCLFSPHEMDFATVLFFLLLILDNNQTKTFTHLIVT